MVGLSERGGTQARELEKGGRKLPSGPRSLNSTADRTTAARDVTGCRPVPLQGGSHPSLLPHRRGHGRAHLRLVEPMRSLGPADRFRRGRAVRALRVALDIASRPGPRARVRALGAWLLANLGRPRLELRWERGRWLVDCELVWRRAAVHARHLEPGSGSFAGPGALRLVAGGDRGDAGGDADPCGVVHRAAGRRVVAGMAEHVEGVRSSLRSCS